MDQNSASGPSGRVVAVLCAAAIGAILVAGLWPFDSPRNRSAWVKNGKGLRFSEHGTAFSMSLFPVSSRARDDASLEVWITPESVGTDSTILAFDSSMLPRLPFAIKQYKSAIAVQRATVDQRGIRLRPWLKVNHVLKAGAGVLVSVTAGSQVSRIYVNGELRGTSSTLGLSGDDFAGELVVGNSTYDDSWRGEIGGLAIYEEELKPALVKKHFERWAAGSAPVRVGEESPVAMYLFDEGGGNIVHNRSGNAPDIGIPARYSVLHPAFLHPSWDSDFRATGGWKRWGYWQDVVVNVVGFLPFGFLLAAYCGGARPTSRSTILVALLGGLLSFMIEGLQRFLPTRDSSMDDLISNTIGTAMGALTYRSWIVRSLWCRVMAYVGVA
jgi:hypothetical protein